MVPFHPTEDDRSYVIREGGIDPARAAQMRPMDVGNQHRVYEAEGVLKVPKRRGKWRRILLGILPFLPLKRARTYQESVEEHNLAYAKFRDLIPHTVDIPTRDGLYIREQVLLHGIRPISKKDLSNATIRSTVIDVIKRNNALILGHRKSIAFLGREGALSALRGKPKLTNVEMTTEGVRIVDFDLLDLTNRADRITYRFNRWAVLRLFDSRSPDYQEVKNLLPKKPFSG